MFKYWISELCGNNIHITSRQPSSIKINVIDFLIVSTARCLRFSVFWSFLILPLHSHTDGSRISHNTPCPKLLPSQQQLLQLRVSLRMSLRLGLCLVYCSDYLFRMCARANALIQKWRGRHQGRFPKNYT